MCQQTLVFSSRYYTPKNAQTSAVRKSIVFIRQHAEDIFKIYAFITDIRSFL